jgi:hypothetical protein
LGVFVHHVFIVMGLRGELFGGVVARFVCSVRGAHVTREIMNIEVAKADSTNLIYFTQLFLQLNKITHIRMQFIQKII